MEEANEFLNLVKEKVRSTRWMVTGTKIDDSGRYKKVLCTCSCGTSVERLVKVQSLLTGKSTSCGCKRVESMRSVMTKHGKSRTKIAEAYQNMKGRVSGKRKGTENSYQGITVCLRWKESAVAFYSDMGEIPEAGMQVDRIDGTKGYWCGKVECPECGPLGREPNCRWATRIQQQNNLSNNTRVKVGDETKTLPEWARLYNITRSALNHRTKGKREFTVEEFEEIAKAPVKELYKTYLHRGEIKSAKELAVLASINKNTMNWRLKSAENRGIPYEDLAEYCINSDNFKK